MKVKRITTAAAAFLLLVSGCGKDDSALPPLENGTQNNAEASDLKYMHPLTGAAANEVSDRRAITAIINNHPKARPQSGLEQADVVYEVLAEGNVTRYLAVYQSEVPERIGPIRSARDYFVQLAEGLDSIHILHGYSPDAKTLLDDGYVDHLNGLFHDGTLFNRDASRKAPHNSYTTYEQIIKGAKEQGYKLTGSPEAWPFLSNEEAAAIEGEEARKATVLYGDADFDAVYTYIEEDGQYGRTVKNEPAVDAETGQEIMLDNIIIMEAPHRTIDQKGRRDIDLSGEGNAYLLQKGKWNTIQWQNIDNGIIFVKDGERAKLIPGKTWVNVVPDGKGLQTTVEFH